MIHGTSVTIVVISPNIISSKWIDWEIAYSLKEIQREDKTSRTNGVVGVVMKVDGDYGWLITTSEQSDGCASRSFGESKLYPIITSNRDNLKKKKYTCSVCQLISPTEGSYISLIKEDDFLLDPTKYIENAWDKSCRFNEFIIPKVIN